MRNAHTLCWWIGFALITITSIVLWTQLSSYPFAELSTPWVLGFIVLTEPQYDIPMMVMALGLILLPTSMALRIRANAPQNHVALTRTVSMLGILVALPIMLLTEMFEFNSTPHLLKPASACGTRVLAVNRVYFMRAEGDVYTVDRGGIIPQHIGSYTEPDGYDPIASNTYALTWQGETPHSSPCKAPDGSQLNTPLTMTKTPTDQYASKRVPLTRLTPCVILNGSGKHAAHPLGKQCE